MGLHFAVRNTQYYTNKGIYEASQWRNEILAAIMSDVDVEKDDDSIIKVTSIFVANFLTPLPCGKFLAPGMRV